MAKRGVRSPNKAVDPERSAAMKGNKNAGRGTSGGPHHHGNVMSKGGARIGVIGSAIAGIPGAFAAGAIVGAAKHGAGAERSHKRVLKGSAIVGAGHGAAGGAIAGAIYGATHGVKYAGLGGAAAGAVVGAGVYAGSARLGRALGKGISGNSMKKRKK